MWHLKSSSFFALAKSLLPPKIRGVGLLRDGKSILYVLTFCFTLFHPSACPESTPQAQQPQIQRSSRQDQPPAAGAPLADAVERRAAVRHGGNPQQGMNMGGRMSRNEVKLGSSHSCPVLEGRAEPLGGWFWDAVGAGRAQAVLSSLSFHRQFG